MSVLPRDSELPELVRSPSAFIRRHRVPLLILTLAAVADAVTTLIALRRFGIQSEVHLVQRLVIHALGIGMGVPVAKAIQVAFVVLVAAWWRPWCTGILLGCAGLYGVAAISNHFVLF